jgi:hypothetical protein
MRHIHSGMDEEKAAPSGVALSLPFAPGDSKGKIEK